MQDTLDHRDLLVRDLAIGFTNQVGHVNTVGAEVHDVDRRTGRDLNGVNKHLTISHVAALGGRTLGLNVSLDSLGLHVESSLVIVANVLDISNLIQEGLLTLLELINSVSNSLGNLVSVAWGEILSKLGDNLTSLFSLVRIDALVARLSSKHLDLLAVAVNVLNFAHSHSLLS